MKAASITIRLTDDEKNKYFAEAMKRDIPLSQLVREAMREYLNQEEKENE